MFSDPIGDSLFGSEALDYFRLTIRPKNVYLSLSQTLSCLAVDRESDDDRAQ